MIYDLVSKKKTEIRDFFRGENLKIVQNMLFLRVFSITLCSYV